MTETETAVKVLKEGGIIIYPTETVYAIGCLVSFPQSVDRLYEIKQRDTNQPTLALFQSAQKAGDYVNFTPKAKKLAEKFWPGPLTICLKTKKKLPKQILGPDGTLGVRVPGNDWCLKLLKKVNEPILAPSANFKGEPPPARPSEIDKRLKELVDYVVDIEPGGLTPSTIVVFDEKDRYEIKREGAIKKEAILEVLEKGGSNISTKS